MSNANLATLVKAPRVLDAAAFAVVLCGAEALLVGVKGPCEKEYDGTDKHGSENQYVPHQSSHVVLPEGFALAIGLFQFQRPVLTLPACRERLALGGNYCARRERYARI